MRRELIAQCLLAGFAVVMCVFCVLIGILLHFIGGLLTDWQDLLFLGSHVSQTSYTS